MKHSIGHFFTTPCIVTSFMNGIAATARNQMLSLTR